MVAIIGLWVMLAGVFRVGRGAMTSRMDESDANAAIRQGALLVPVGLAFMLGALPAGSGIPAWFVAGYFGIASLLAALIVVRFSEDRPASRASDRLVLLAASDTDTMMQRATETQRVGVLDLGADRHAVRQTRDEQVEVCQ